VYRLLEAEKLVVAVTEMLKEKFDMCYWKITQTNAKGMV